MSWEEKLGLVTVDLESTRNTQESEEETLQEGSFNASEVETAARTDINMLAALAMPNDFKYLFPVVFVGIWQLLCTVAFKIRDFTKLAIGLPRGFAKTTVIKLFILFCILFTKKQFILVISASSELAEGIIADVFDYLSEPNIKAIFGDWQVGVEKNTEKLKKFNFRGRNIIVRAAGAGTAIRGIVLKNRRPDVMVFEDVQTRECADSKVESDKLYRWMLGTAMKAKSPSGCMYLFIANMYPTPHSILKKLIKNHEWDKVVAGGILSDGTSLWEELHPIKQLISEYKNDLEAGHPEIFHAEVLNDGNASMNNLIDVSRIPPLTFEDTDIHNGNFVIIDPATDKANADAVSLGYVEVRGGIGTLIEVIEGRLSPGDTIREAVKLCLKHNCRLVAIEANSYQYTLLYWSKFICQQYGISGIEFVDVYSGQKAKTVRIINMFKQLLAGEVCYHPRTAAAVNIQIGMFNPLKTDNVDGILDLLTYIPKVIELYGTYLVSQTVIKMQEYQTRERIEFNSPF